MDIHAERRNRVLTLGVAGRLDGYGAGRLEEAIGASLQDDDRSIVIDCEEMTYLSSAGIRIFIALKKRLKERGGTVVLARVGDYPRKVLEMAGVHTVIAMYPTLDAAVGACFAAGDNLSVLREIERPSRTRDGVRYSIETISRDPGRLRVTGSLQDVLFARIDGAAVRGLRFSETGYSLGLGALGESAADAMPLLGEMITLHGSMVWLPADGHDTPDFLNAMQDTGDVRIYSGFNATLDGQFAETITIETESDEGITLADLYRLIFSLAAERRRDHAGVIAVAIWAVTAGVCSSGIKRSPLRDAAPADGSSIMDPQNIAEWIAVDEEPKYRGDTMVGFGIGVNLAGDLSAYDPEAIDALSYRHPANRGSAEQYLHNHGVIFRGIPWDGSLDLERQIRRIVTDGEFVDMRHLLDSTRVRKAKLGVAYIAEIVRES